MLDSDDISATTWDAVIAGTGLRESLIAAALSRAGKQVLHVDKNNHYGGRDAALSLDEVRAWVKSVDEDVTPYKPFHSAACSGPPSSTKTELGSSRQYSLSISPQILHLASPLLPLLVNNRLHQSMEFVKVGSWHIWTPEGVQKVPGGREDVFKDKSMDLRTKRSVVRFLKGMMGEFSMDPEDIGLNGGMVMFKEFLTSPPYSLPESMLPFVASLTSSYLPLGQIPSEIAVAIIKRHMLSTGRLGPGYCAVVARYGTGSEIVQVLCRAAAVAGEAVYVLGQDIKFVSQAKDDADANLEVTLGDGKIVKTKHLVGEISNLAVFGSLSDNQPESPNFSVLKTAFIIGNPLTKVFETAEPPVAASAVVYIPEGAILSNSVGPLSRPIHMSINNHESGECNRGQCIVYTTSELAGDVETAFTEISSVLAQVVDSLKGDGETASTLFWLRYAQSVWKDEHSMPGKRSSFIPTSFAEHALLLPPPSIDLTISDSIIASAKAVFEKIIGSLDGFMESNIDDVNDIETDEGMAEDG